MLWISPDALIWVMGTKLLNIFEPQLPRLVIGIVYQFLPYKTRFQNIIALGKKSIPLSISLKVVAAPLRSAGINEVRFQAVL